MDTIWTQKIDQENIEYVVSMVYDTEDDTYIIHVCITDHESDSQTRLKHISVYYCSQTQLKKTFMFKGLLTLFIENCPDYNTSQHPIGSFLICIRQNIHEIEHILPISVWCNYADRNNLPIIYNILKIDADPQTNEPFVVIKYNKYPHHTQKKAMLNVSQIHLDASKERLTLYSNITPIPCRIYEYVTYANRELYLLIKKSGYLKKYIENGQKVLLPYTNVGYSGTINDLVGWKDNLKYRFSFISNQFILDDRED